MSELLTYILNNEDAFRRYIDFDTRREYPHLP